MKRKLKASFWFFSLFCCLAAWGQTNEITGIVYDPQGVPIPGANVILKNTSTGVVTDFDGEFSIEVPSQADNVLVFSSIGFASKEFPLQNQTVINITLQTDVTGLEEVVVVGYGSQKKRNVTGAVATIDAAVLESRPITDIGRGLQGASPGLTVLSSTGQIGQDPIIKLRGSAGTLGTSGGAQPLILVDNVEIQSLQFINP